MPVPTRPRLGGAAAAEPQTDAGPDLGHTEEFAERAGGLPTLEILFECQRVVRLGIHLDDFGHLDGFGALAQRLRGQLIRRVDARRFDLQRNEAG